MNIYEAINKIEAIHNAGIRDRIGYVGEDDLAAQQVIQRAFEELGLPERLHRYGGIVHSGKLYLYTGTVQRGLLPCPHCGVTIGMGYVVVVHEDGRAVELNVALYHYPSAGHPITCEDVDIETLIEIVEDA